MQVSNYHLSISAVENGYVVTIEPEGGEIKEWIAKDEEQIVGVMKEIAMLVVGEDKA